MKTTPGEVKLYTALLFLLARSTWRSRGESSTCLMVYKEGGAPAVFQSPKCPRWKLPDHASSHPRATAAATRCHVAMLQGRRKYQEDRAFCAVDVLIPFPGKSGLEEVTVGIIAVFDGHNGAEASEMASKLLFEYFVLHTYFLLDSTYSIALKKFAGRLVENGEPEVAFQVLNWAEELSQQEPDLFRFKVLSPMGMNNYPSHLDVLKEALLRAIRDIDAKFSKFFFF
ncbi:probable protein phosphatase 2C 51 [Rhodamnia argentea]|uniref:Probable protein phosphatase 2C 51 n=1 Tax=Rhodamnia argentea TaxID=178133 RepID=A0ABM3HPT2_9MYRT|nr:probable protein phosphatase 2C 51 [Rhodamnia argentea]